VVVQVSEEQPVVVSRRRAQTRDRLLVAATHVFAERGVIGASVEEICEAAAFTRGAFYSNFADKDALVLALLEAETLQQFEAAKQTLSGLRDAPSDLGFDELVTRAMVQLGASSPSDRETLLMRQELMLHAARVPALREPYAAFVETSARHLRGQIEEAVAAADIEFVLPFEQAIELMEAAYNFDQNRVLFGAEPDLTALRALILTITRPKQTPQTAQTAV
jgi:AcrR family transcriptional regulator